MIPMKVLLLMIVLFGVMSRSMALADAASATSACRIVSCSEVGRQGIRSFYIDQGVSAEGQPIYWTQIQGEDGAWTSVPLDLDPESVGQYVFTYREFQHLLTFESVSGQWVFESRKGSEVLSYIGLPCY